jgi:hypothetical protein
MKEQAEQRYHFDRSARAAGKLWKYFSCSQLRNADKRMVNFTPQQAADWLTQHLDAARNHREVQRSRENAQAEAQTLVEQIGPLPGASVYASYKIPGKIKVEFPFLEHEEFAALAAAWRGAKEALDESSDRG